VPGPPRVIVNTKYHPFAAEKLVDGYVYQRVARARLVVEAALNNMPYDEFVHALKHNEGVSMTLRYLPEDWDVHHEDEDTMNDDLSNLRAMPHVEHARLHGKVENFGIEYVREVRVASVEADGSEMTYDIQMDDPARNFVANGIVVHNTGKSLLAKSTGNTAGVPTIKMDLGAMHGSLVGESQNALRHALKVAERVSQGRPMVIATCNSVAVLPPELVNRFKWRFFVDLPDREEKDVIWRLHLKKRDLTVKGALPSDENWNGREIDQACETAYQLNCTVQEAAEMVVPMALSSREEIEDRRREATGRYLSASKPGAFGYEPQETITDRGRSYKLPKVDDDAAPTWMAPGTTKPS